MSSFACLLAQSPLATMSRPVYPGAFMHHKSAPRCHDARSQFAHAGAESLDDSLLSTVLLVVVLAVGGAFFIMAIAYFLGEDHNAGEHSSSPSSSPCSPIIILVLHPPIADGAHALLWAVKQSTRGCATMC